MGINERSDPPFVRLTLWGWGMTKSIIALPTLYDAATLTPSSETTDYETGFLQTRALSEK